MRDMMLKRKKIFFHEWEFQNFNLNGIKMK